MDSQRSLYMRMTVMALVSNLRRSVIQGLSSCDFAIHFIQRTRDLVNETGSWHQAMVELFEEPARAISRNAIVISLGFLPLLLSPLIPYQTVGIFLAAIMATSCLITLLVLPTSLQLLKNVLFNSGKMGVLSHG